MVKTTSISVGEVRDHHGFDVLCNRSFWEPMETGQVGRRSPHDGWKITSGNAIGTPSEPETKRDASRIVTCEKLLIVFNTHG